METAELVWRIIFVCAGLFLLVESFVSLVKKRMSEGFSLSWALGAFIILLMGIVPGLSSWTTRLSVQTMVVLFTLIVFMLSALFWGSIRISELFMQTHELAMQVSLLNQENEKIMKELYALKAQHDEIHSHFGGCRMEARRESADEEENSVRD